MRTSASSGVGRSGGGSNVPSPYQGDVNVLGSTKPPGNAAEKHESFVGSGMTSDSLEHPRGWGSAGPIWLKIWWIWFMRVGCTSASGGAGAGEGFEGGGGGRDSNSEPSPYGGVVCVLCSSESPGKSGEKYGSFVVSGVTSDSLEYPRDTCIPYAIFVDCSLETVGMTPGE